MHIWSQSFHLRIGRRWKSGTTTTTSVTQDTHHENLKKCRVQSKYAGKVTDVHKGVVYIRLSNGVNAVAHACYNYRTPGKKDDCELCRDED